MTEEQRPALLAGAREELERIDRIIQDLLGSAGEAMGGGDLDLENAARSAIATVHHQLEFQELDVDVRLTRVRST